MDLALSVTFYFQYRFPWDTTFCIITSKSDAVANLLSNFQLNEILMYRSSEHLSNTLQKFSYNYGLKYLISNKLHTLIILYTLRK